MRRIALVNQKGGCGKTTVAVNLAACLASRGRSILLIDLDPQGHSTIALGGTTGTSGGSAYDLLCGEGAESVGIEQVALPVFERLDVVGSDLTLSTAEQRLADVPGREERLRRKLEGLTRSYDFVIIDCPPNLGILTINALLAAKEVLIPVEPSAYSLHGLAALERTLAVLRDRAGHEVQKRILPNLIDHRIAYHRRFLEDLQRRYANEISGAVIRRSVKVTEAAAKGRPVTASAGTRGVADDFRRLGAEILGEDRAEAFTETRLRPVRAVPVRFALERPGARWVSVAGSFNNWRPDRTFLAGPDETGKWSASVRLRPGEYEYRFIADGEWVTDPLNPTSVPSPMGSLNSLVRVDVPRARRSQGATSTHAGKAAPPRQEEASPGHE